MQAISFLIVCIYRKQSSMVYWMKMNQNVRKNENRFVMLQRTFILLILKLILM